MTATTATTDDRPAFLFDDCCPLCRSYTAAFSMVGWTGRQPFSAIDAATFDQLDFDRARHQIPLVDLETGSVRYGLDGILGVAGERIPLAKPVLASPILRRPLDALYWLITYNRRHIVAAPPPPRGRIDCAPDHRPAAVATYVVGGSVVAATFAALGGTIAATSGVAVAGALLVGRRTDGWKINGAQAAGHLTSIALAAAGAGVLVAATPASATVASTAAAVVGVRKIWLRRWMTRERR